jgi:CBS domain-containing protein
MTLDYAALPLHPLGEGARLRAATPHSGERPTLDSRALSVMTDFAIVPAATIEPAASVDDANRSMIRRGVRSLVVVDHERRVLGLITAADLLGERPMQIALERGLKHHEIPVREVMTPSDRVEALPIDTLLDAKIGHVIATLAKAGRQHALVVERTSGGDIVRGIFSLTQIAAQLGISIEAHAVARTFAEVEAVLLR